MLNERRAVRLSYDSQSDTSTVVTDDALPQRGSTAATLLLDKKGFLVGIDVTAGDRVVVMLGGHEEVASQTTAHVDVHGTSLSVAKAKSRIRGDEKNPYV